jgi:hypothetical protein
LVLAIGSCERKTGYGRGMIGRAVNAYEKNVDCIAMKAALQLSLECVEELSWEAKPEAQAILKRLELG